VQPRSATDRATLADEQAALRREASLRRIATLVAEGGAADDLFAAVAREVADLFGVGMVNIDRYEDGESVVLASFDDPGFPWPSMIASRRRKWRVGSRWPLGGPDLRTQVYETGRPAREDGSAFVAELPPGLARAWGTRSAVAVPIVVDGKAWGVLGIASKEDEPLPADTEQRLTAFTELVATAIVNAESRGELAASEARARELASEQAALRRVATLVAQGASPDELFAAVAREVAGVIGVPVVGLHRYGADAMFTVLGMAGDTNFTVGSRCPVKDEGIAGMILATGRPARKYDYSGMPGPRGAAVRADKPVALVGVPIMVDGSIWGFLVAAGRPGDALPADTEVRLARFTELVATAIANSQAREHLARLADEQAALRRVAALVAGGASSTAVFDAVAREVAQVFQFTPALVARYEDDGATMTALAAYPASSKLGSRWPLDGPSVAAEVLRSGRPVRMEDWTDLPGTLAAVAREQGWTRVAGAPIIVDGRVWGLVSTAGPPDERLPENLEDRLAEFTQLVATAIANSQAHEELAQLADEQAALRRVATLVAQGASPDTLFSAVAKEVAGIIDVPVVGIHRYEADGTVTTLGVSGESSLTVGTRLRVTDEGIAAMMLSTGRPSRIDDYTSVPADAVREDMRLPMVGVPIVVEGSIWGFMVAAAAKGGGPLPAGTEERLARFTELVATAVSNATTRTELLTSRARVVSAGDETRRRLERDLHDGIQQWLVALALRARKAAGLSAADELASQELFGLADDLVAVTDELREISRGIHPAILSDAGLDDALAALARRSAIRVDLDVSFKGRYDPTLEATVYYVAAESITNAVKHAQASTVTVRGGRRDEAIELEIRDDGVGGADPRRGTGLIGLKDRVDTLGGTISFASPAGAGTAIRVKLPACPRDGQEPPRERARPAQRLLRASPNHRLSG
jgi:signal transduction histidine kinase